MRLSNLLPLLSLAFVSVIPTIQAQEVLTVSGDEINRLAIVFEPLAMLDQQSGDRFPATVITSPNSVASVSAAFSGVIQSWNADPGDQLDARQVLATIRSQDVLEIQTQWLLARANLRQSLIIQARQDKLFQQGIVSQQRLQQANSDVELQQLTLATAGRKLSQAGFTEEELQQLTSATEGFGLYAIRSPIEAQLLHRTVVVGDYVEAFAEVASLRSSNQVWLSLILPARLGNVLQFGQRLSLAGSGETLSLMQKDREVDETTQTVEILAQFDTLVAFLPGQILSVVLPSNTAAISVPAAAVVHNGEDTLVFIETAGGVEVRNIQLQAVGSDYAAASGLEAGERVAIQGAAILKGMMLGLGRDE